jgi:hypothetical protein
LTSSFILAPPINVEEMVEYWTSKGCDCNIMFQRIRDYHTTNPVCEISNGKELAKIPGSQTIKSWVTKRRWSQKEGFHHLVSNVYSRELGYCWIREGCFQHHR